jgi:hypothetical protein
MPAEKYAMTRTDGAYIGKTIRELVRLMIEDGFTWQAAADAVGIKRSRAVRHNISTGGILIVLNGPTQRALPAESGRPVIEMVPADE